MSSPVLSIHVSGWYIFYKNVIFKVKFKNVCQVHLKLSTDLSAILINVTSIGNLFILEATFLFMFEHDMNLLHVL